MPGPFSQLTSPFGNPAAPPNPALYQPSPPTDQSQTTASILGALARSLFAPAQGAINLYDAASQFFPSAGQPQTAPMAPASPVPSGGESNQFAWAVPPGTQPPHMMNPPGGGPVQPQPGSPPAEPSPGGPPVGPPMLRPTPDGGDAVAGGGGTDPGSVLSTAVQAGQLAQNDPNITQSVIKDLMAMGGDPEQNKWLALAKAGFSMAASRNPSIFGAAGEGALAGLSDYQQSRQQGLAYRYQAAQLQQAAQEHAAQIAYQQQQQALAQKEYDEKVREYNTTLPLEQAKNAALVDMYEGHTNYFNNRATGATGGAGGWRNQVYASLASQGVPPAQIALVLSGKGADPVAIAKSIMATSVTPMAPEQAVAQAKALIAAAQGGIAAESGQPTINAPAAGGQDNSATIAAAKQAISQGADPTQVKARLQSMGINPALLGQ